MDQEDPSIYKVIQKYTSARVGLRTAGTSIATSELLQFRAAHAAAKDAVEKEFVPDMIITILRSWELPCFGLSSKVKDKVAYLLRPDFGKVLSDDSIDVLNNNSVYGRISIVIADGLSSSAINNHSIPFLSLLIPALKLKYTLAPITVVKYGRVAIGDMIGAMMKSEISIVLIGERPGLSSPDSMGIYITYQPTPGTTDESRNCISNIHRNGLSYKEACYGLLYLVEESLQRKLTGVQLKDLSEPTDQANFDLI